MIMTNHLKVKVLTVQQIKNTLPKLTKTEKRLSTIESIMTSISVS